VGGAASLLAPRAVAGALVGAGLVAYYAAVESLWSASDWWDISFLALVVLPAMFALVYLLLPLWRARGLLLVGLALGILAAVLDTGGLDVAANFAKLAAVSALGFWFLGYFESVAWVVLVACLVPWVDAYSVWRGPTEKIVTQHEEVFTSLSIAFPIPGEHGSANLGLPDVLFFALFLAATVRFRLRTAWTWVAMTASFGATMALAVAFDVRGLPALPLLSLGFLAPNADLLWRRRPRRLRPADA
jgi:hypothetical protein